MKGEPYAVVMSEDDGQYLVKVGDGDGEVPQQQPKQQLPSSDAQVVELAQKQSQSHPPERKSKN